MNTSVLRLRSDRSFGGRSSPLKGGPNGEHRRTERKQPNTVGNTDRTPLSLETAGSYSCPFTVRQHIDASDRQATPRSDHVVRVSITPYPPSAT
jgi:hypothetical protein